MRFRLLSAPFYCPIKISIIQFAHWFKAPLVICMCAHLWCVNAYALYEVIFMVVCIVLLGICVFWIDWGSHHTSACSFSLSNTHENTCILVSLNDLLAEPDSGIPFCLSLGSWNEFWPEFGLDFAPQHTFPAVLHISSQSAWTVFTNFYQL